jgi:hypothetical protein
MHKLTIFALCAVLALFLLAPRSAAADPTDSPLPGPVDDITSDFEALPDLYGLGALVALAVVLVRRFGLPDGWGGYAAFAVGVAAYIVLKALPEDTAQAVFDFAAHVAEAALLVLGSQITHASLKHAGLDKLWKARDGQ